MNQPNRERQHLSEQQQQQQQEEDKNDDNCSIVGVNSSEKQQGWPHAEELDKVKEENKALVEKLKTAEQKAQVAKNEVKKIWELKNINFWALVQFLCSIGIYAS
jgi:methylmalonyl-CoA mutase N-terminal domain/subunit